jgi:hypothetical protein
VFVAYVWSEKIAAADVGKTKEGEKTVMSILKNTLYWDKLEMLNPPAWLKDLLPRAKGKIDAACVLETMYHLGEELFGKKLI